MNYDPPVNANYAATVVRVEKLLPARNADRLQIIPLFGFQAVVGLETQVGDMGIFLPAESQLSEEFCYENNLFTHSEMNKDQSAKGYIESKRRIKAIKLRQFNRSDALFMPLSSLAYTGVDLNDLKEGDCFDTLNGHVICRKYEIVTKSGGRYLNGGNLPAASKRVSAHLFPEHFETPQYFRVDRNLDPNSYCVVTQKLHGTSIRIGHVPVKRTNFSWKERLARRFGVPVQDTEHAMVYGSHHSVKDANNPDQAHFYEFDLWTHEGKKLDGLIPPNYILYGELVGWVPRRNATESSTAPIQKHYTYKMAPGECKLFIYRVAIVNHTGDVADLSWEALKEFCASIGVAHVPELWTGRLRELQAHFNGDESLPSVLEAEFLDQRFHENGYAYALPLSDDSPCDEGVCIRIEATQPVIVKAKSPNFYQHESAQLDTGEADIESEA